MVGIFSVCDALWQLSVVFLFPCLDSCGCPISRCAIFVLMFRAARVAVLLILGFLFFNLVCGYVLDYPCIFSVLVFWLWGRHPIDLWSRCWWWWCIDFAPNFDDKTTGYCFKTTYHLTLLFSPGASRTKATRLSSTTHPTFLCFPNWRQNWKATI
jgi:hypothetical protein